MELHHNIHIYIIKETHNSSKHIYNFIKVNFLNSKPVNTIQDAKKRETKVHLYIPICMHIHEVSKYTGQPCSHLLPTYIQYRIITSTNHTTKTQG